MNAEAVLITGVSRRLGLHMAKTFLDRSIPVIGTFRTERESIADLRNMGAELYQCDFYDNAQIEQLVSSIQQKHQRLRAVIHNASDWLTDDNNDLTPAEVMQRMIQVHVTAPYQLNMALEPLLKASTGTCADIVHIGDFISSRGSKKHVAYAASKAAQDNMTLSFASRLAPKVKVNSLAPSLVIFNDEDDETYRTRTLRKSLMQKEGGLEEFQASIDYLMQSKYVTGRVLPMDGGRHLC